MKIGLFLMNQKGLSTLKALIDYHFSDYIGYVVGARDAAVTNDFYTDIKEACSTGGIKFYNRKDDSLPLVDYKIAIGWRWIISSSENLIVLHDSLLPKYRGFAPLVNTLIKGDTEIGVTAIWAEADYDTGEIIIQEKATISYPVKIQEAIEIIALLYHTVCINIFKRIQVNQPLVSYPQSESEATFSIWRDAEDYRIDWSQSAAAIKRFVDAVGFPYPGARTLIENSQLIYITDVQVLDDAVIELRHTGKVLKFINGQPVVICGSGLLLVNKMSDKDGNEFTLTKLRTRFK